MQTSDHNHTPLELAIKKHLEQSQLPQFDSYLFEKIADRLDREIKLKALKPKLWAAFGFLAATLALLGLAINVSWHAFAQTPTLHYLSLIFTDFGVVLDNWQDFSLGILESLPLGALAFLLSAFLASLLLIDFSSHQFSNLRKVIHGHSYFSH